MFEELLIAMKRSAGRPQDAIDIEPLEATPAERLKWLEEALAFAARAGALPPHR